jgi:2-polyprenyl-3-methyl-5-hydroxy-6-metoxy-1,4-benzoquinol methylase
MSTSINNVKIQFKRSLLAIVLLINAITNFLPRKLKSMFIVSTFLFEGYSTNPRKDLVELLLIKDELEKIINNRALAYGGGEHPKHYLTKYHQFFIDNINDGERVIDIGCGYGAVSRSIAKARPKSIILGIDNDEIRLKQAIESENPSNLSFIYGDVTQPQFKEKWDVVVLSNVLEHIESRIEFLTLIFSTTKAKKFLIRVPCYERNWEVPLKESLGMNYFTDSDHKIEHKLIQFQNEITKSNLILTKVTTQWGEIWAVCEPAGYK